MFTKNYRRVNQRKRHGSVCVEFALVAPIFFLIVFSSIEFARVHMLQCAVENACFEGARRGIVPGATATACKATTESLLNLAGISDRTVTVTPSTIDANTDTVTITATVKLNANNGFGMSGFLQNKSIVKEISLPRE